MEQSSKIQILDTGNTIIYQICHSNSMGGSPGELSEELVTQEKRKKGRGIKSSAHSPTFPSLHLRHNSFSNPSVALPTSQLILQPFRCFTYVTVHYPTLPSLYLRHSSFSNAFAASPTSQFILQPFFRFTYVTSSSFNSPGEPPMSNSSITLFLSMWLTDTVVVSYTLPEFENIRLLKRFMFF